MPRFTRLLRVGHNSLSATTKARAPFPRDGWPTRRFDFVVGGLTVERWSRGTERLRPCRSRRQVADTPLGKRSNSGTSVASY